ncbi:PH domain-containing protein [Heyndrickxia sp. NPDC080065]|uniref:PH domain-containing protein n=1 Tax=Heyndrickxia sp. NPDC080065 TaxID=3390568 RepID=UPI003CFBD8B5
MTEAKRYHPLNILFDLGSLVKNSFFFFLFLFVIKYGSKSHFIKYGRIAFLLVFVISIVYFVMRWLTHKYKLDDTSFHIYKGIFTKSKQTIPFSKIQNVNRRTSLFHRIFQVTSLRFETGMAGDDATIDFEVISRIEADRMEDHVTNPNEIGSSDEEKESVSPIIHTETEKSKRVIHFKPTTKDTLKASFTSFSFLLLIPIILSIYGKINDIFHVEKEAEGIFSSIIHSWWVITLILIIFLIVSIAFGIIRTFIKYGKYEISSDTDRIYIVKGVIDETSFSISKERVQGIEITQSIMKRILGLAEVKLISAGNLSSEEEKLEINSLYPFLPVRHAYEMISEILPSYEVTKKMSCLPKLSLWVRMLKPSWIWIIATAVLFYFKPTIFGVEQAWWIISAILLIIIGGIRLLSFFFTRYTINQQFIQFKTGSFTTTLFLSKRDKVIEVSVTRGIFQKLLGLASVETVNRAKPVHHAKLADVPVELAVSFYKWYIGRRNEIEVE